MRKLVVKVGCIAFATLFILGTFAAINVKAESVYLDKVAIAGKLTFQYIDNGSALELTKWEGRPWAHVIHIPGSLDGVPVTSIANFTFDLTFVSTAYPLVSIFVPSNITSIGVSAFANCTTLSDIYFEGNAPTSIGANWIQGCSSSLRGHAPGASDFPDTGYSFHGLVLGNYTDYPDPHGPADKTTTVTTDNLLFSVSSNSTVSGLKYDPTARTLSFNVSGTPGTQGYAEIVISKQLVNDSHDIRLTIDAGNLNYQTSSDNASWDIYFTYHHSTHNVVVDLKGGSGSSSASDVAVYVLIGIIAAVIVGVAFVVWQRKKK